MPLTDRLQQWLREAGVVFELLEHAPVYTSEDAARVRGTPLEQGAKALVVRADDRFVHCVLPAHLRADNAALRTILSTRKLRFATREELYEVTGCPPGAVPPFGNLFGLPVLLDEALCRNDRIVFNAGSNAVSIIMSSADLIRLSGATVCRLSK
ncbi:MAG TPA: YbaK/EbsC family protein [Methylomirabilota bacterium]|nr:YbaK/EbsC family protein [Methylomirabilota bacterium]